MAYTALYRKWRPETFDEVKGQDALVETLRAQVRTGRVAHAYLFSGTRGTGKTSLAKILARAVNCENPGEDGSPCNECASCRAILAGNAMNVIEIDAASNNGVDNVREIRDEVKYPPAEGRYRVYIIDEVHMLSTGAFNALLKTLEEPPSYVLFILATTEIQKIPATVISRCQRYDFARISAQTIEERLAELCEREGISAEPKALSYLARKADGGMRDAISLLDQCAAAAGKDLTLEDALKALGAVDFETYEAVLDAMDAMDAGALLTIMNRKIAAGSDAVRFTEDLTGYLRNLLLFKASGGKEDLLDVSAAELAGLREREGRFSEDRLIRAIRLLAEARAEMRQTGGSRTALEVAMIRLVRPQMQEDLEALKQRVEDLEKQIAEGVRITAPAAEAAGTDPAPEPAEEPVKAKKKEPEKKTLPAAQMSDLDMVRGGWKDLLAGLPASYRSSLRDTWAEPAGTGAFRVVFPDANRAAIGGRASVMDALTQAAAQQFGKEIHFTAEAAAEGENGPNRYVSEEELRGMFPGVEIE